ncbi:uncharacterized protein [Diadema antillarum]|uniref:uncharacterized protein n=1 Tax=Diadema antillarum TaxID=105358 RepID=UPI003A83BB6A
MLRNSIISLQRRGFSSTQNVYPQHRSLLRCHEPVSGAVTGTNPLRDVCHKSSFLPKVYEDTNQTPSPAPSQQCPTKPATAGTPTQSAPALRQECSRDRTSKRVTLPQELVNWIQDCISPTPYQICATKAASCQRCMKTPTKHHLPCPKPTMPHQASHCRDTNPVSSCSTPRVLMRWNMPEMLHYSLFV